MERPSEMAVFLLSSFADAERRKKSFERYNLLNMEKLVRDALELFHVHLTGRHVMS
ncbi:MAG: hypothetical protein HGA79_06875, partial [Anaerolineales bacterium]|nr:hypothetical protein [Anaerolineales bacterium]